MSFLLSGLRGAMICLRWSSTGETEPMNVVGVDGSPGSDAAFR
jgi:hypothetical protein